MEKILFNYKFVNLNNRELSQPNMVPLKLTIHLLEGMQYIALLIYFGFTHSSYFHRGCLPLSNFLFHDGH